MGICVGITPEVSNINILLFQAMSFIDLISLLDVFPSLPVDKNYRPKDNDLQNQRFVPITRIEITRDENQRLIGKYEFSDELKELIPRITQYLESYTFYLDDINNQDFSIQKIFHAETKNNPQLYQAVALDEYFENLSTINLEFLNDAPTVEGIKKAEVLLVRQIAEIGSFENCEYLPLPEIEIHNGEIIAMRYLVYDRYKLSKEAIDVTDQLPEKISNVLSMV